jgi:hypothetical protein
MLAVILSNNMCEPDGGIASIHIEQHIYVNLVVM